MTWMMAESIPNNYFPNATITIEPSTLISACKPWLMLYKTGFITKQNLRWSNSSVKMNVPTSIQLCFWDSLKHDYSPQTAYNTRHYRSYLFYTSQGNVFYCVNGRVFMMHSLYEYMWYLFPIRVDPGHLSISIYKYSDIYLLFFPLVIHSRELYY